MSVNPDRGLSAAFRFAAYGLAALVVLSAKLEEGNAKQIMSLLGILLVAWAIDGFIQLLTGVSLLGDPLIELGESGAVVTGSLQLGYGATIAILSRSSLKPCDVLGDRNRSSVTTCVCSNCDEQPPVICGAGAHWFCCMGNTSIEAPRSGRKAADHRFRYLRDHRLIGGLLLINRHGAGKHHCRSACSLSIYLVSASALGKCVDSVQRTLVHRRWYSRLRHFCGGSGCFSGYGCV